MQKKRHRACCPVPGRTANKLLLLKWESPKQIRSYLELERGNKLIQGCPHIKLILEHQSFCIIQTSGAMPNGEPLIILELHIPRRREREEH